MVGGASRAAAGKALLPPRLRVVRLLGRDCDVVVFSKQVQAGVGYERLEGMGVACGCIGASGPCGDA